MNRREFGLALVSLLATPEVADAIQGVPDNVREQILSAAEKGSVGAETFESYAQTLQMAVDARAGYKMRGYFPDTGPFRRELYPKHLALIAAGKRHRERCFLAGNRVGKTELGAYETTCHLTGLYPDWWPGRKFEHPIDAWAAGDTSVTVRDIIQEKLLGDIRDQNKYGTGMLPRHTIQHYARRGHTADAVEKIWVRHVSGGTSTLGLLAYESGREAFQGTAKHLIWLDEEPEMDIYTECLMRTMTTDGLVLATFTPLRGRTPLVVSFLGSQAPERAS